MLRSLVGSEMCIRDRLALAIAAQLLVGSGNMSFFGSVVTNVISLVNQLGNAGLAGLISVGIIMWLFGKK